MIFDHTNLPANGAARIYNPTDETKEPTIAGEFYVFAPGETVIRAKGRERIFQKDGNRQVLIGAPLTLPFVLSHIVGPDGMSGSMGKVGFRVLHPTDEDMNAKIKAAADVVARYASLSNATALIASHEKEIEKAKENGVPPPVPSDRVLAAYATRAAEAEATRYICPRCQLPTKSAEILSTHIATLHPDDAHNITRQAGIEPEPVKRGPGRPRKEEAVA